MLKPSAAALLGIALAVMLSGCSMSDDELARLLVAPDKYKFYNCKQIAEQLQVTAVREKELRQLMQKAGPGSDGRVVSAVAYRPEYLSVRGDMNELRAAAAAKNCDSMPGGKDPDARMSDSIIR